METPTERRWRCPWRPWRLGLGVATLLAIVASNGSRIAAAPSTTPRLDWLFDGTVSGTARIGNTLYVGGSFAGVTPRSDALGWWLTLSTSSGAALPGLPPVDGTVAAVEPDGAGGYFIAGTFANAGAAGVAHIRADGSVDPVFLPQVAFTGPSPRLVRVGVSLVVGGFASPLKALDPVTGAASPWVPTLPNPYVGPFEGADGRLFVMTSDGSGNRRVTAFDGVTGGVLWTSTVVGNPGGFADVYSGAMAIAGTGVMVFLDRLYALDAVTGAIDPDWGGPETPSGSRRVDVMEVHGSTLYLAGTFTDFRGQPRNNLAAVDIPTGNLLPWNPDSASRVMAMAVAPDRSVFVSSTTSGGVSRRGVAQIDSSGAVTSWTAQPLFSGVTSLAVSPAGNLLVGVNGLALAAITARASLAAFDLTTGALLPATPVVAGSTLLSVAGLLSRGDILYLTGIFDSVNGQPRQKAAAVDVTSGTVLPWPAPGVLPPGPNGGLHALFVFGDWVYGYLETYGPLLRIHATTGVADPVWRADTPAGGALTVVPANGELVAVQRLRTPPSGIPDSRAGVLELATGTFLERSRFSLESIETLAVDGGTLYFVDPTWSVYNNNSGALRALDAGTGLAAQVPPVTGQLTGVSVVDGRLFPAGQRFTLGGTPRDGIAEVARPGALTAWRPAVPGSIAYSFLPYNPSTSVFGDRFVRLATDGGFVRLLVFDLSGPAAPANLRVRTIGAVTEFTWDPPASVPPGGYVVEGGFGPGQTAAAVPVGTATSLALPLPPGPIHVRVRAQGDTEVSNEVVAGCVAPPASPTGLTAALAGPNLTLTWTPPPDAVTTTLLAGTTSGSSNLATLPLGGTQTSIAGAVPPGTYFARMTASNACGTSGPSGEVFFTVGAVEALPAAPTNLAVSLFVDIFSVTATFTWTPPPGSVTGHQIEAGTGPGLADIATAQIGPDGTFVVPNVPRGAYYVRVRAVNAAGSSAPSTDVALVVP